MRIAVTGGAGFIGRACVRRIEERGHQAVSFDARDRLDVQDGKAVGLALGVCDSVIHLAGVLGTDELFDNPDKAIDVNIKGSVRVLEACADFGLSYVGITMPDCWANFYQATKQASQKIACAFHRDLGVPVTHIKAFNAYGVGQAHGPGHPQKIIPTFATKMWSGEPIPVWGEGDQTVDLVSVGHIANCLVDAAILSRDEPENYGEEQVWDAGSGVETSVMDVLEEISRITRLSYEVEHLPMRRGETEHTKLCADIYGPYGHDATFRGNPYFEETVRSYAPAS